MTRRAGVTLIETLAALALLAVIVPVLTRAWLITMDAASRSRSELLAAQLAEDRLNEIVADRDFAQAESTGDFGTDQPGYRWQAWQADWIQDSRFREIFVTVTWTRRQIQYATSVGTIVDATP